jgi:tetratricopeptide (TPR) repeat protein
MLPKYLQTPIADEPKETYFARSIQKYRDALKEHPEDEALIIQPLMIYLSLTEKDYDEAIHFAQRLLTIADDEFNQGEAYTVLARCYENKNDIAKAEEFYKKAMELDLTCYESIEDLGDFYAKRFDWDNAIKTYKFLDNDAIVNGRENMNRFCGFAHIQKQEYDLALNCFLKANEIHPNDTYILETTGQVYWFLKQYDEALVWLRKALVLNPNSASLYYGIGLCMQDKDDFYLAMHNYIEAIKLEPDFPEAYNNIAKLYLDHEGDIKKAIELFEKAVESNTDKTKGIYYLNLSRIYNKIADYDKADFYNTKFIQSLGFDVEKLNDEGNEDIEESD